MTKRSSKPIPFWQRRDRDARRKLNLATLPICIALAGLGYLEPGAPPLPDGFAEQLTRGALEFGETLRRDHRRLRLSREQINQLLGAYFAAELAKLKQPAEPA